MIEEFYTADDRDEDLFLSHVPLSLLKENIKNQFDEPMEYRKKDHMSTFLNMFKYSEANADPLDDEEIDYYKEARIDFYEFMKNLFAEKIGLGFVDFDDMLSDAQDDIMLYTYRFFLINIKKNFIAYVINTISQQRGTYEVDDKKKDVTTLSFRKEIDDPIDIHIISNLYEIIVSIISNISSIDEFFTNCDTDESCLETRFVRSKYDTYELTGNFTTKYASLMTDDFLSEIESNVRNIILAKYKKTSVE